MSFPLPPSRYGVLVPVKPPAVAKSRLGSVGDELRAALVVAFAVDTITAALESPLVARVLAVTDDHTLAAGLADLGAAVIPDGTTDNLNASLVQAAAELERREPGLRIAALCADLPALRPDELTKVLSSAPADRMSFVADADHVGTTVVLAPTPADFAPQFGSKSRLAHLEAGAVEIDRDDVPGLRRDVDTAADLEAALELGVGVRTLLVSTGMRGRR